MCCVAWLSAVHLASALSQTMLGVFRGMLRGARRIAMTSKRGKKSFYKGKADLCQHATIHCLRQAAGLVSVCAQTTANCIILARVGHLYVACWSVCDWDEEGYIVSMPWSHDRLSKKALIAWFNFDPGRKCFYMGHVSDYRAFSCDIITFEIMKRKTIAMLVYNEIGASMAIFTEGVIHL